MYQFTNGTGFIFLVLPIIFLTGFKTAEGQDSTYKSMRPSIAHASFLYNFPMSYGVSAGTDFPFKAVVKNHVSKDGRVFTKHKDKFYGVEVAAYRYPFNYTGILGVAKIGTRHYIDRSFFYETSIGVGILRTFYDGIVYQVNSSGAVTKKPLFGRFYATTHLSTSINYALKKTGVKLLTLQIKPSVWFQYPFESFIKPQVSLEAGIQYGINLRNTNTRSTTKYQRK